MANVESIFLDITHVTSQIFVYKLFFMCSLPGYHFQNESKNEEYPYMGFSMGIDHSNPYIHNTTVLCDWSQLIFSIISSSSSHSQR